MSDEMKRLEEKPRTEVRITVKSAKGYCAAGNHVGSAWVTQPRGRGFAMPRPVDGGPEICAHAFNSLYPYVLTLLFGGGIPYRYEGTEYDDPSVDVDFIACPDPVGAVVYEVRRVVVD